IVCDELQRRGIFPQNPFDAERSDLLFKKTDGQLELALFNRNRDQLIRKWRALLIRGERVQQRETVFPTGNADGHAVARTKHGEAAHRAPNRIEDPLFNVSHYSRSYLK